MQVITSILMLIKVCRSNPSDGHTLNATIDQATRISKRPGHLFIDLGYRRYDCEIHVDKNRSGKMAHALWRWIKRRAVVEPRILILTGLGRGITNHPGRFRSRMGNFLDSSA